MTPTLAEAVRLCPSALPMYGRLIQARRQPDVMPQPWLNAPERQDGS